MKFYKAALITTILVNSLIGCTTTTDKPAPIHDTVYVEKKKDTTPPLNLPKDAQRGDFNGDGVTEYVWLVPPKLNADGSDCEGDCISVIKFSNPTIPDIKVEQCIGGIPAPKGDLDDDKGEEIGLNPEWFTSCWSGYKVYTLKNNQWIYAVEPFSTYCDQWEKGVNPIEKDPNHPGHVIIRYSENTVDSIVIKEKSIPVK